MKNQYLKMKYSKSWMNIRRWTVATPMVGYPIAKEAFYKFSDSNLGDPGLFKGTKLIEDEVLKMIGSFLSIENPAGHIVTGGTEANLMAMRAARNIARDKYGIENGEIIVPKSAHFSFNKASDMLNLKLVNADLNEDYTVDSRSVSDLISDTWND